MTTVQQFDPSAWVDDEVMRTYHANQRTARGFSQYDWYNLNTYLAFLFARVCEEIIAGTVEVKDDNAHKTARVFLNTYVTLYKQYDAAAQDHVGESEFIAPFFADIFPHLPSSGERYYTPTSCPDSQRATEGISAADLPVARSYLASIMMEGLSLLASPLGASYPADCTFDEWVQDIKDINFYLLCYSLSPLPGQPPMITSVGDSGAESFNRGKRLIVERFPSFWD